jgi:L-iditol 2-dehydrogenase
MKALMLQAYKQFELVEVATPHLGREDVLVRVRACGICGSDVHGLDGSSGRRMPPLIMGHEAAGEIMEVGPQVTGLSPGDRVTFDSTVYCGRCHFCRRGDVNLCDARQVLGVSCGDYRRHGALAEYVAVPQHIVYKLPPEVSFVQGSLAEPVAIALHAVNRAPLSLGDTAVVVGAGMIGLLVIQVLRLSGCGRIIAVDLDPHRLALAAQLGADEGLNPAESDVPAEVQKRTGGRGADVAFEVVGAAVPFQTALAAVRKGGALVLVGNLAPVVDFPLQAAVTRELTLLGTCASRHDYPIALQWIAQGKINADALITAVAPLEEGAAWFDRLYRREPGLMKVILQP